MLPHRKSKGFGGSKRALIMHENTHESIRTVRPLKYGVALNAAELLILTY